MKTTMICRTCNCRMNPHPGRMYDSGDQRGGFARLVYRCPKCGTETESDAVYTSPEPPKGERGEVPTYP